MKYKYDLYQFINFGSKYSIAKIDYLIKQANK